MVRLHLEYGNDIWWPFYQENIGRVEAIQKRMTKLVNGLNDKPYEERLKDLTLPSLVYRCKGRDMIQMFKVMNGLVRIDTNVLVTPNRLSHTRGHPQRVFKNHAVKLPRTNSFMLRVINNWKSLPAYIIEAPSVKTFKNKFNKY